MRIGKKKPARGGFVGLAHQGTEQDPVNRPQACQHEIHGDGHYPIPSRVRVAIKEREVDEGGQVAHDVGPEQCSPLINAHGVVRPLVWIPGLLAPLAQTYPALVGKALLPCPACRLAVLR